MFDLIVQLIVQIVKSTILYYKLAQVVIVAISVINKIVSWILDNRLNTLSL